MKVLVKDFSTTMQATMVIFGSQVHDALLYRGIENQSSSVYSSLYLSSFLYFHTLRNEIYPRFEKVGVYWFRSVRPSVRLYIPSFRPSPFW